MNEVYIRQADLNRWIGKYFDGKDLISIDDLLCCIEELDETIESLNEQIEKLKYDMQEFYTPIPKSEFYGI